MSKIVSKRKWLENRHTSYTHYSVGNFGAQFDIHDGQTTVTFFGGRVEENLKWANALLAQLEGFIDALDEQRLQENNRRAEEIGE